MRHTIYIGICVLFFTTACTQQSITPNTQKSDENYTSIIFHSFPEQQEEAIDSNVIETLQKQQQEENQMSDIAKYMRYQDKRRR